LAGPYQNFNFVFAKKKRQIIKDSVYFFLLGATSCGNLYFTGNGDLMTTGTATAEELALSAAGVNRAPSTFWQYPSELANPQSPPEHANNQIPKKITR